MPFQLVQGSAAVRMSLDKIRHQRDCAVIACQGFVIAAKLPQHHATGIMGIRLRRIYRQSFLARSKRFLEAFQFDEPIGPIMQRANVESDREPAPCRT